MKTLPLGLLILTLLTGCEQPVLAPPPPPPARVIIVGDTAYAHTMTLVGETRPRYESIQGFRIGGKITQRSVEVGTRVTKGQRIASLDSTDTQLSTAAAIADVRAAEASFALAVDEMKRQQQLFAKKFISASALDSREAELKTARAHLAQVKAQAAIAVNQTHYALLTADQEGFITAIQAEPGQVVTAGEAVVTIANTQDIDVLVSVPESQITAVNLKTPVNIRLWADRKKTYSGVVREIAPAADSATRTFKVRIALQAADNSVKFGMTAEVSFNHDNALADTEFLIPSHALTELEGKKIVWVINADNKAQPREVDAEAFREDGVLISRGLQAGEHIAVAGVHTLFKDQQVKPMLEVMP